MNVEDVYYETVKSMVDTDTVTINTGLYDYKGKKYELVASIKEIITK